MRTGRHDRARGREPLWFAVAMALCCLLPAAERPAPVELARPTPQQYAWHEQERIQFVCLDPCTWQGREYDDHSTPPSEIDPARLDTGQWCRAAKLWGAKEILFVAKHTGGFCWWRTETTRYGIKETPWRGGEGDLLAELAASCREHGLNLGVYVYPGDDTWGAPGGSGGRTKDPAKQEAYNRVFRQQLTEVLTRYGKVTEVWFDGSCVIEVGDILERHAPDAVVFQGPQASIRWPGTETGRLPYPAWNSLKLEDLRTGVATAAHGDPDGDAWAPLEADTPLYDHNWFWSAENERKRKGLDVLMDIYYKSAGRGGVLLLNSTPNTDGRIPDGDLERYADFGREIERRFGRPLEEAEDRRGTVVELSFPGPTVVNHVVIMEDYREGERIREYVVEGSSGGDWAELSRGTSVGRKKIDRFRPAPVVRLRLRVIRCAAEPIVRRFSAFHVAGLSAGSLTTGRPTTASTSHSAQYVAEMATDDDPDTRWGCPDGTTACWLEVDLGELTDVGKVAIRELADRIRGFVLEHRNDPSLPWRTALVGTRVGSAFQADFPTVSARFVRLNITDASGPPTIWELNLYPGAPAWERCGAWTAESLRDGKATLTLDLGPFIKRPGQYEVKLEQTGGKSPLRILDAVLLFEGEAATPGLLTRLETAHSFNVNRPAQVTGETTSVLKLEIAADGGSDCEGAAWIRPRTTDVLGPALPGSAAAPAVERPAPALRLAFCCGAENDLYRVATECMGALPRHEDPAEAVERAPDGAGVLILAEGYPGKRTAIAAGVLEAAARKNQRLYVEYPESLPGLALGEPAYVRTGPYGAVVERTVVASDAFGPRLGKLRILMIHDCHYLPVEAASPHLVLAQVEGYDTAVYGLPPEARPILFEHPQGAILVATTKLSQFVTARYAPSEAWPSVWKMVFEWLQPGASAPELRWTPTVRPMYPPWDALPDDALLGAVRRGVEYYGKSRLYIHPSWPKDTGLDPLPADWPVGDGTHGIGECYISKRTFVGGNQAVSRTVRADCNLEAAMGLACGVAVLGDLGYRDPVSKLNDLVFFGSTLCGGPRADPGSPSYGLIGGSTQSPGLYWGDDNARALLSAIASSALVRSDRWNEAIVRGILANFRTTGIHGFRPLNIAEETLQASGWKSFFDSPHVDYCPHMESWLWATYLWLHERTRFAPLLERSRTGIRRMMAAYPNWRLEANRLEQERCRMLLPLAWLVRAEDTPEHRAWLETIARYVIDLQDPSGAIPQIPGRVVASNAEYGTSECALTHSAGDPATDALYSINFAFVGMHEAAAATGDADYAASAGRMADFFVRTQTRSEEHPELDGTWYRSFDYRKWDYWGSDGDAGWGVWTNEIGWTHSWITTVLALRRMETSLWDLSKDVRVAALFDEYRSWMLPDDVLGRRIALDLSGPWRFLADRTDRGVAEGYFSEGLDASSWRRVVVPTAFDGCGPDMDRYIGIGWFRRTVDVPETMRGRRVVLHFEGINYNAAVWVNGKPVGESHDAFLPFDLEVGETLRYGATNVIAVRVDNIRRRGQFPLFEGWYGQGGFLREASLVATDRLRIDRLAVRAEPDGGGGRMWLEAVVANGRAAPARVRLRAVVDEGTGRNAGAFESSEMELSPGGQGELEIEASVADARPWSPTEPALYRATTYLVVDGAPADVVSTRFGFRKVEAKDARIVLNGKPVLLVGFNRHEDSPRTGMAVDLEQARADLSAMKAMGCNYVRLCHYPHHPGELDLCDELGLAVMIESSMNEWGHLDHGDPNGGFVLSPEDAPLVVENGKRTILKMVERDRNHPCVILCSVGNESAEERPEVVAGNSELIEYGRGLDPTRLWTHVSNSFHKPGHEGFYRSDDVVTINCYPTHSVEATETNIRERFPQSTRILRETVERLHGLFPGKPLLIGEFGYPGGESGPRGAEIQAAATEAELSGLIASPACGASAWCYARHPWARGAVYAGSQLVSPYGYTSRDRTTRFPAMAVIERMYRTWASRAETEDPPPDEP